MLDWIAFYLDLAKCKSGLAFTWSGSGLVLCQGSSVLVFVIRVFTLHNTMCCVVFFIFFRVGGLKKLN